MTKSIFFLALSFLGKLYSGILLPFYLQRSWLLARERGNHSTTVTAFHLILFITVVIVCYLPFIDIGEKAFEGLKTYTVYWQSNDSLFALLFYFLKKILAIEVIAKGNFLVSSMLFAKSTIALVILGIVFYILVKKIPKIDSPQEWVRNLFIVIALVFLVSPVQNPWYLCWTVPFLCIFHSRSLILLTGLVGLYYLDFYFDYQEITEYSIWIPWIEYIPFYFYMIWEIKIFKKWKIMKQTPDSN